jgi:hypothetical protein
MKTRPPAEQQPQPPIVSACDILKEMLSKPPKKQVQRVGGGVGMTGNGQPVWTPSDRIDSTDEDTNRLLRAKFACEQNMVVSPYSSERSLLYTTRDKYPAEVTHAREIREMAAAEADRKKNNGWFSSKKK